MDLNDFDYHLPDELIAQEPPRERGASRLLVVNNGGSFDRLEDAHFTDLEQWLRPEDLLVLNDTRVVNARLLAKKPTGGRIEILVERSIDDGQFLAQIRSNKRLREGSMVWVADAHQLEIRARDGQLFRVGLPPNLKLSELLEQHGSVPLPPYIRRDPGSVDAMRYQTVYAAKDGAVAAPTAGLHLSESHLDKLRVHGVTLATITLHVGLGTFSPVRSVVVESHRMHAEQVEVSSALCDAVTHARARGGRVIAVGTTCVRALESASLGGTLCPYRGDTELFIYPGFKFNCVDALITNFHLPRSTLMLMVSAFAGTQRIRAAYRHAVAKRYRFFSYGDAMLLFRQNCAATEVAK